MQPFAPVLVGCLDLYKVNDRKWMLERAPTTEIMVALSKLPAGALEPHIASIARWLCETAAQCEVQAPILSPCLKALAKLPPAALVEHLPALEQPHWLQSKLLVNKVRRAAGLPRAEW